MDHKAVNSLEDLYQSLSDPVFSYLLRLSGDPASAEELTGETFYKAMLALEGFRGDASLKTWLFKIARNLYLRQVERDQRTTSLEALYERGFVFTTREPDPESHLLRQELCKEIKSALLSLSESDRSILHLSVREKMPCKEIAQVLEISLSAVKVRLYRARRRLAAALNTAKT